MISKTNLSNIEELYIGKFNKEVEDCELNNTGYKHLAKRRFPALKVCYFGKLALIEVTTK